MAALAGILTNCDAHGGGIFVGSGEIPEGLAAITSTPTTMGAVSLNKSTVDCNEAKGRRRRHTRRLAAAKPSAAASMPKALSGPARPASRTTSHVAATAQRVSAFPSADDYTPSPAAAAAMPKGGGIFSLSFRHVGHRRTRCLLWLDVTLINCVVNFNKAIGGDGGDGADGSDGGRGGDATGGIFTTGTVLGQNF